MVMKRQKFCFSSISSALINLQELTVVLKKILQIDTSKMHSFKRIILGTEPVGKLFHTPKN
jgi:hypothetical protein